MDTSSINTEYYKVFYYVGRLGSITAAAEALCISQPAVSQAVKPAGEGVKQPALYPDPEGRSADGRGGAFVPLCGAGDRKSPGRRADVKAAGGPGHG